MKKIEKVMVMVGAMKNNEGLSFVHGACRAYKTGYTVILDSKTCKSLSAVYDVIEEYDYTCGVYKYDGYYIVDQYVHCKTKRFADILAVSANMWRYMYMNNKREKVEYRYINV